MSELTARAKAHLWDGEGLLFAWHTNEYVPDESGELKRDDSANLVANISHRDGKEPQLVAWRLMHSTGELIRECERLEAKIEQQDAVLKELQTTDRSNKATIARLVDEVQRLLAITGKVGVERADLSEIAELSLNHAVHGNGD